METTHLKESYGTLSETINALTKLGYTHDFNLQEECLVCKQAGLSLSPNDFNIDQVYRFDGDSDPEYQSILYVISSDKFKVKGTLVNGYGTAADEVSSALIKKLSTHPHHMNTTSKTTDATPQRPNAHVIDAPLVQANLNQLITQLKQESPWQQSDRNSVTVLKSDTMRIVLIGLHASAELTAHKAPGTISVQVLQGKIEFATGNQRQVMGQGELLSLQENIVHSVKALEESFFLLTMAIYKVKA